MALELPNSPVPSSSTFHKVVDAFLSGEGLPFAGILSVERIERIFAKHGNGKKGVTRWGQTRDSGLALELLCVFSHCRPSPLLLHTEQAATLRFQRIDNRHRRRMFRPTAEIAHRESRYQVSNRYSVEALLASKREPYRWSVRNERTEARWHGRQRLTGGRAWMPV